jgi:hypothetical protein
MKTRINFLSSPIRYFFGLIIFVSCHKETPFIQVSVLRDVTDTHMLNPDAHSIIPLYKLSEDVSTHCLFRMSNITDRQLNAIVEFSSTSIENSERNIPFAKEQQIVDFYKNIKESLLEDSILHSSAPPLEHSECFSTIASELHVLSRNKATKSYLQVYSDLRENSGGAFNAYSKECIRKMINNPEHVVQYFESKNLLPISLHGIHVQFIYYPIDRAEDDIYRVIVTAYKTILENRGAKVEIKAQNNKTIPDET